MKIIHCADLHLDSRMTAHLDKEKAKERRAELLATFVRMVEYAEEEGVEAILIAGDLYDTKNISATAKNALQDVIKHHPAIAFYYLRGNHDGESFLQSMDELPDNLYLFQDDWISYPLRNHENIVITGVELSEENHQRIYNSLVLDTQNLNILMLHGQEVLYQTKDNAFVIQLPQLKNKGIDYLALGHIHSYKEAQLDSRGVYCYPGCLEGRGFDECGEHGFVLLEIDETLNAIQSSFIPFAKRNLYNVFVDITGCETTSDIVECVREELYSGRYGREHLIKVILTGQVDVECEKNMDFLLKQFEDDYYFVRMKDETKIKIDYQQFVNDISLKGEFVRLVLGDSQLSEEEKGEIIRCGILALKGEELI